MNLDMYLDKLLPWNFTVTYQSEVFKTRAPLVADLALLENLNSQGTAGLAGLRDALKGLFVGGAPDLDKMPFEALLAIASKYTAYFQEQSKKNLTAMGMTPPPRS